MLSGGPGGSAVDTDRPCIVERSVGRLLLLSAIGILLTALGGAIALGYIGGGIFASAIGALCTLFFGAACGLTLWRLLTLPRGAVILDHTGLHDLRISPDVIPWSAIEGARVATLMGQTFVVLTVEPEVEKRLRVSLVERLSRAANESVGFHGLFVAVQDLRIDAEALYRLIVAYREAHAARGEPPPGGAA